MALGGASCIDLLEDGNLSVLPFDPSDVSTQAKERSLLSTVKRRLFSSHDVLTFVGTSGFPSILI